MLRCIERLEKVERYSEDMSGDKFQIHNFTSSFIPIKHGLPGLRCSFPNMLFRFSSICKDLPGCHHHSIDRSNAPLLSVKVLSILRMHPLRNISVFYSYHFNNLPSNPDFEESQRKVTLHSAIVHFSFQSICSPFPLLALNDA